MLDKRVEDLKFSVRTTNALKKAKIKYLSQVLSLDEESLFNTRGIGRRSAREILSFLEDYYATNSNDDEKRNENSLVINEVFPQCRLDNQTTCLYRNDDGFIVEDINIDDLKTSVRLKNCLKHEGIITISEIVFMPTESLKSLRNFGNHCFNEVLGLLRTKIILDDTIIQTSKTNEDICTCIEEIIKKDNSRFCFDSFKSAIKKSIEKQNSESAYKNTEILKNNNLDQDYLKRIFSDSNFTNCLNHYIYAFISERDIPTPKKDIALELPQLFTDLDLVNKSIRNLSDCKLIEHVQGGYIRRLPTISEWLESLHDERKEIILMRLSGKTLKECGRYYNLSRERIRQITTKLLSNRPRLKEDQLKYWFEEYDLSLEQFCSLFGADKTTYYYLTIITKKGMKQIDEIENDVNASQKVLSNLENELRKTRIFVNGRYLRNNRVLVVEEFGRNICASEAVTFDELYSEYKRFLKQIGKEDDENLLYPNQRAFEVNVSLSHSYLLQFGKKVRFYPIFEYDVEDFLDRLNLKNYRNIEISTLRIYRDNLDLMEEYDIQNEYELHNLLKKTSTILYKLDRRKIDISRMPLISFGKADRKKQTIDLLFKIAPVTVEEFANEYEEEYGVLARTVMANMHQYISEYCHAGVYSVDQKPLRKKEKEYLLEYLQQDFYYIDDVIEDFGKIFGENNINHVNPKTIRELGYRVFANCIVNKKYKSLEEYFIKFLSDNEIIDLNAVDQRLMCNNSFSRVLNELRNNYNLLEFEEKKYISFERFQNVMQGVSKSDLLDYAKSAIDYAKTEAYFTIDYLRGSGFNHELHKVALGNWFFASIIKYSRLIKTIDYGKNRIFYKSESKKSAASFIESIMKKYKAIDIDKFIDLLGVDYGLSIRKGKLIGIVKNTNMYYDSTMHKIYIDKDCYYDDLR